MRGKVTPILESEALKGEDEGRAETMQALYGRRAASPLTCPPSGAAQEPLGLMCLARVYASREPKTEDSFHCGVNVPGHILHPVT